MPSGTSLDKFDAELQVTCDRLDRLYASKGRAGADMAEVVEAKMRAEALGLASPLARQRAEVVVVPVPG